MPLNTEYQFQRINYRYSHNHVTYKSARSENPTQQQPRKTVTNNIN